MKVRTWTAVLLTGGLLAAGGAHGQSTTPTGQNPLDAVPEKMPFSTPYGTPISLEKAQAAVQAAVAEANKRGWPLNIAVVDKPSAAAQFPMDDRWCVVSSLVSRGPDHEWPTSIPSCGHKRIVGASGVSLAHPRPRGHRGSYGLLGVRR